MRTIFLLIAGLALSCTDKSISKKIEDAHKEVALETVHAKNVKKKFSWAGFIRARREIVVPSEVEGGISRIYLPIGERVQRGQTLFDVNPQGGGREFNTNSVLAPISGVVSSVIKPRGSIVKSGEPVMIISDPAEYEIDIQIAGQDASLLNKGDQIAVVPEITLDGTKKTLQGTVNNIAQSIDPQLGTVQAVVAIKCDEHAKSQCVSGVPLGSYAELTIEIDGGTTFLVNRNYLREGDSSLWTISLTGTLQKQPVTFEATDSPDFVEIKTGIADGVQIVTTTSGRVKPGDSVNVVMVDGQEINPAGNTADREGQPAQKKPKDKKS